MAKEFVLGARRMGRLRARTLSRHDPNWYEIDFTWYGIWFIKKLGLASQVHCANVFTQQCENEIRPSEPKNGFPRSPATVVRS
jgi:hypothetical protein